MMIRQMTPLAALLLLSACGQGAPQPTASATPTGDTLALSREQIAALGIVTARAEAVAAMPVGTVPGVVSLPPEARVAVSTPYAGTLTQIRVIPGQAVRAGEVLGVVQAAQAVQIGADLARTRAALPVAQASAARLSQLAREGVIAPARADEARANLAATRASLAEGARLLALGKAAPDGTITLRAPITGRVAQVQGDVGSAVGNGVAPFLVESTADLRLDLQVPERLAGKVAPGMTVTIVQDGMAETGRLLSVAASLDPQTRALPARAALARGSRLVPGKAVSVTIAGTARTPGVAVPAAALSHDDSGDRVFVRSPGGFRPVRVTLAGTIGDRAYLAGGLRAGEQVAASGVSELAMLRQGR